MNVIYIIQAFEEVDGKGTLESRNVCFFLNKKDAQLFIECADEISEMLFNDPNGPQKHPMDKFYSFPKESTAAVYYLWEAVRIGELE